MLVPLLLLLQQQQLLLLLASAQWQHSPAKPDLHR
jgi:hypothetical protein